MAKRKQYSLDLKEAIVGAVKNGALQADVSRQFNIPYQTVGFWCRNQLQRGHVKNLPRKGRPKKTTPKEDKLRVRQKSAVNRATDTVKI